MSDRSEFVNAFTKQFEQEERQIHIRSMGIEFVARKRFTYATSNTDGAMPIGHLSKNFIGWFLSSRGEVEKLRPVGTTLAYRALGQKTYGKKIVEMFQKEENPLENRLPLETRIETYLVMMYASMVHLDKIGHRNNTSNVFFVRDKDGALRTVVVWRGTNGWYIFAFKLGAPLHQGWRVFWEDRAEF